MHSFYLQAPTHHSFTFNLRLLYELKHKVRLSKRMHGIFHFQFCFIFIKFYIFVPQNNRKATHTFAPRPDFYVATKGF